MTDPATQAATARDADPALHPADNFIAASLARLTRGVRDRRSDFHVIGLATSRADGAPRLRSVVLRGRAAQTGQITFHTDARSAKFAELARDGRAALLAYSHAAKLQIRIEGEVTLHHDDAEAEAIWRALPDGARQIYRAQLPPGTEAAPDRLDLTLTMEEAARHFAVCHLRPTLYDVLWLRPEGHRRAIGTPDGAGKLAARWVAA
ncbi:MAG TPA: pyridoxamine 5'-phosphate oxidase family protein [Acidiphilium sp.]|nr:pyridoxamine 5'-phosphate oxidase family protein [Acidiphilium sp.]